MDDQLDVRTQIDNTDFNSATVIAASTDTQVKPYIGMEFSSDTEAYIFYNTYALRTGFGVRKTSNSYSRKKNVEDRDVIARTYVCDKEGKKISSEKDGSASRRESKVGCGARMRITVTATKKWKVSVFVEEHNGHDLTSPDKSMKHRSHQIVHKSQHVTNLMDRLRDQGLVPSNIAKVVNVTAESSVNAITPQQCQVHLRKRRSNNIGNECMAVINQFVSKKVMDPDFYYAWEVDENRTMRSVFWVDGRSRSSYLKFGDVVVFDVTYRTNNLCLPFAPFTGVNHHRQSILLGCALLADESEETFVWLFTEWLNCMHGKPPVTIITDQDVAIGNAVERVFPTVHHRYCSWHINNHVIEKLPILQARHGAGVITFFDKWRSSATVEQAEQHWSELKEKFDIDENANTWLPTMYRKRHHWIEAYLKDVFYAGMRSTQRSESINSFFDGYVNAQTRLNEFISCYDRALDQRRAAELDEDFRTLNTKSATLHCHAIEAQAASLYTRSIFKLFQQEMRGIYKLIRSEERRDGHITIYTFQPTEYDGNKRHEVVYEKGESINFKCSCALFEMSGLLCKHILHVMCNVHQLQVIPERYILPRWRIDARHRNISGLLHERSNVCNGKGNTLACWAIKAKLNEILRLSSGASAVIEEIDEALSAIEERHQLTATQEYNEMQVAPTITSQVVAEHIIIRDPRGPVRNKGRPGKATRVPSRLEVGIEKKKKKQRTCQNCLQKGHYRNTCKNPPANSLPSCAQDLDDEDDDDSESLSTNFCAQDQ